MLVRVAFQLCITAIASVTLGQNVTTYYTGIPIVSVDMDFASLRVGAILGRDDSSSLAPSFMIRTLDSGNTWEKIELPFDPAFISFPSEDALFCTSWAPNSRLWRSRDVGETWEPIASNIGIYISFPDRKHGFTEESRSSDSGSTWQSYEPPENASAGKLVKFNSGFQDSTSGFIASTRVGHSTTSIIWGTTNSGDTWEMIYSDSRRDYFPHEAIHIGDATWLLAINGYPIRKKYGNELLEEVGLEGNGMVIDKKGRVFTANGEMFVIAREEVYEAQGVRGYPIDLLDDSVLYYASVYSDSTWETKGLRIRRVMSINSTFQPLMADEEVVQQTLLVQFNLGIGDLIVDNCKRTQLSVYDGLGREIFSDVPLESDYRRKLPNSAIPMFYRYGTETGRVTYIVL